MNQLYPYSSIVSRKPFTWPEKKRLAVYVAVNIESYSIDGGLMEELLPASPPPDVLNYSYCDYGNRVGVWRVLALMRELNFPVTLLVNSRIYDHAPEIVAAFRERGDEISSHGRTNSERQSGMSVEQERALIQEATSRITTEEGKAPAGWLSPWISETENTPELLREAGYKYLLDWCCDDQPVWMATNAGSILAVPYPQELNDSSSIVGRFVAADTFADMIVDQFDEMLRQSEDQPLVMGIALHPHISGQPFRLPHLRRALRHITQKAGQCWLTRAGSIADHYTDVCSNEGI